MTLSCSPTGTLHRERRARLAKFILWLQAVAHSPHAAYQVALFVSQLFPQVAYMHVNGVCVAEVIVAPDAVENNVAGEDLARVGEEKLQHFELAWGKLNHAPGARY